MQDIIKKLGLTPKQGKIYLCLLEMGTASISELAKNTEIKRPSCYLLIDELIVLGLINEHPKGKRKVYSAIHPRRLLEIARHRERDLEEAFPQLLALHNAPKNKPRIHVFEYGYDEGVNKLYEEMHTSLEEGKEALFFTNFEAFQNFPKYIKLYQKLLKQIPEANIRELICGEKATKYWKKQIKGRKNKNHLTKILPPALIHGSTDMMILQDKLVVCSLNKEIFITLIESQDIADSQRALFECAWQISKEI